MPLVVETVPIHSVTPHPRNARIGNVDKIRASLREHDQYVPIVVQRSTAFIIKGNHTWQAAVAEGRDTIDLVWSGVDDDQALRILLMDNASSDDGRYDETALALILEDLMPTPAGLGGTGWTPEMFDDLLLRARPPSLDELHRRLGDHQAAEVWPFVRLQLAPATRARFEAWWSLLPGDDDNERALGLLDSVNA